MNGSRPSSGRGRGGRGGGRKRPPSDRKAAEVPPHERQRLYSECSEDHCSVCLNRLTVFAVGRCNHVVCGECSTRLRVICNQNECPICRQDQPKVFHTTTRRRYEEVENNVYPMDRKIGICFENEQVQSFFNRLLEHSCGLCEVREGEFEEEGGGNRRAPGRKKFTMFKQLDKHMRVEHDRHYCDLCTDHLKLFSHERRYYNRSELALHRRKGDTNDTSHRGHPLCEFCQARFYDNDELFRHLRKDHFFCHFCDADGSHLYFPNYEKLRDHFQNEHYLCEEGSCINEQFTSAFRSEIDLKAHRLDRHSGGLSKAATKQNRTVDIELTFTRPLTTSQQGRRRGIEPDQFDQVDGGIRNAGSDGKVPDMAADFPTLESTIPSGGASGPLPSNSSSNNLARMVASSSGLNWSNSSSLKGFQDRDFPSLTGSAPTPATSNPAQQKHMPTKVQQLQLRPQKPKMQAEPDFPSLSSDVGQKRSGSDNLLANFRPAESNLQYRKIPGQTAAWQGSSGQQNHMSAKHEPEPEPEKKFNGPQMVSLKKHKEAPPPLVDDFPDLGPSKGPIASEPAPKNKKKKNKPKTNGFMIGDDVIQAVQTETPKPSQDEGGARLKGTSNLQTAADLIFSEKKMPPSKNKAKKETSIKDEDSKKDGDSKKGGDSKKDGDSKKGGDSKKDGDSKKGGDSKKDGDSKKNGDKQKNNVVEENNSKSAPINKSDSSSSAIKKTEPVVKEETKFQPVRPSKQPQPPAAKPVEQAPKATVPTPEQFPSLGATSRKNFDLHFTPKVQPEASAWKDKNSNSVMQSAPTKVAAPPPGFQTPTVNRPAPPPGFSAPNLKKAPYIEPSNFAGRNRHLLSTIMSLVGGKSVEFERFKNISSRFRNGDLSSNAYHDECLKLIDRSTLEQFLPQLIALLPDKNKQQELFSIHQKKFPTSHLELMNCSKCGQVLIFDDVGEHEALHGLDHDFPQLGIK